MDMSCRDFEEMVKGFKSSFLDKKEVKIDLNSPNGRYTSFDYCYNYFWRNKGNRLIEGDNLEKSCLVLGFYLASWGMLRGSSFLLQKSIGHYKVLIEFIAEQPDSDWWIDLPNYNEDGNVKRIIELYNGVRSSLIPSKETGQGTQYYSHKVLVSKVMLGVWGMIPAFDRYFCETFKRYQIVNVDEKSLNQLSLFYSANKAAIEKLASQYKTIDFVTGKDTNLPYSRAKIIDMYGFQKSFVEALDKHKGQSKSKS